MKKFLLLILLITIFNPCSYGSEIKKISLQEALDIAVENNIDYQASKMDIGIAENKVKASNRLQNPEINTFF